MYFIIIKQKLFLDPLLSGAGKKAAKLKPKVFSKTMGHERNVIESHSIETSSPMDEDDGNLILDEESSEIINDRFAGNNENLQEFPSEPSILYNQPIQPAVHSNQLTPSVSLTPISQTSSTANPPIAKHHLPATAMMNSSISPKPSAKKPSKQSKLNKLLSGNQISRPVLRPNDMTPGVTCSIHCELAGGFPALSCHKCQVNVSKCNFIEPP